MKRDRLPQRVVIYLTGETQYLNGEVIYLTGKTQHLNGEVIYLNGEPRYLNSATA